MARTFFAGRDYTFIAGVSNETNDNLKKKREAKFGYTVDDGPMQDLVDGNGKPVEAVIVGDMLEITVQFPETLIGKKVRLYAYVRKQENGKSFEIEVLKKSIAIDMTKARNFDTVNNTSYVQQILDDLKIITGLSFTIEGGFLQYANTNSTSGSKIARSAIIKAIDQSKTAIFDLINNGKSHGLKLYFCLNVNSVNSWIKGSSSTLNNKTMGFGMMFVHEMLHTDISRKWDHKNDNKGYGFTGVLVNTMNIIRSELGPDYGERLSYVAWEEGGKKYLPFDAANKTLLYKRIKTIQHTPVGVKAPPFRSPSKGKFIIY